MDYASTGGRRPRADGEFGQPRNDFFEPVEIHISNGRTQSKAQSDTPSKKNAASDERRDTKHQHERLDSLQRASVEIIGGGLGPGGHGLEAKIRQASQT